MSEKEFDSSINEYEEINKPSEYIKQQEWEMAIGLQKVDNLKPSKYLEKLLEENIIGKLSLEQVKNELRRYYIEKEKKNEVNHNELECDFVSARIVELLNEDKFELSVDYIKYIHEYLFKDVYEFAGEFRKVDFSKHEKILNNDSVAYGDCKLLEQSLDYDISLEKNKNYNEMNIVDVINSITNFSSSMWQIHPFREGNTRTTAVFIEKYLVSLGYDVDNTTFKEKSVYYRNALVRSNYFNNYLNIKEDNSFLVKFYENLLLGKNNNLHSYILNALEYTNEGFIEVNVNSIMKHDICRLIITVEDSGVGMTQDVVEHLFDKKLDKIEEILASIFEIVKRKPEKRTEIRKLMQYYLPMTVKVVTSYRDFENEKIPSRQLEESKREIRETLDKVIIAFEALREKIFQEEVLDVSTDLDVLEAMMSQEGLIRDGINDFKR